MRTNVSPRAFAHALQAALKNPVLQKFGVEQMRKMIIGVKGSPGSGFAIGKPHPWKAHTYRRARGPGSYDYEANLEIYNRRQRKAGHHEFRTLKAARAAMGEIV